VVAVVLAAQPEGLVMDLVVAVALMVVVVVVLQVFVMLHLAEAAQFA
jgi:hypothetical protein